MSEMSESQFMQQGDAARKAGRLDDAIAAYLEAARSHEIPGADACLKLARCYEKTGDIGAACEWLVRVTDAGEHFPHWQAAASLLMRFAGSELSGVKRFARVAILGSYTTAQFVPLLKLAALRMGIAIETYEADYGQYQQAVLDPASELYRFEPDFIVFAVHAGTIALPDHSSSQKADVDQEIARWRRLWEALSSRTTARIIMHNVALPVESPMGHLAARLPGSRHAMLHDFNARLGEAAGNAVSIVDCERLAGHFGKRRWFDDKYWHVSKQAVSLEALPMLARHTAAVLAADLGLAKKCLVLDLDNTLWGGVIGEDGLAGIALGAGPVGEAFVAFQEYVLKLKNRGLILAVCSKNNEPDALEPFEKHPDMRIKLDDIAMFVANWQTKVENIRAIAQTLNIGLDSLVFVDDNPVEREIIRQMIPEVEVITLPSDPTGYVRALAETSWFEMASYTAEDAKKTEQYRARAEIARLEASAMSLEAFFASLDMHAEMAPFDELHLPRIVQLIGKTNQFNLTTRRHTMPQVERMMDDSDCVHFYLKLRDRFTDHGLVSLLIARRDGNVLDIDTWLMSCRVIGRTVENAMLARLCLEAGRLDCTSLRGTYMPTAKNGMVKDIFERFGFSEVDAPPNADEGATAWRYDLVVNGPIESEHIDVSASVKEHAHDAA